MSAAKWGTSDERETLWCEDRNCTSLCETGIVICAA
jgi:hypothetical protein